MNQLQLGNWRNPLTAVAGSRLNAMRMVVAVTMSMPRKNVVNPKFNYVI